MILVVDNYDSFTYNLVQLLAVAGGEDEAPLAIEVVRNDAASAEQILARGPSGIVLSPGPGRPEDAGVCLELFAARPRIPVLGVCLGHQALGVAFGATVDRAPRLMHGKSSPVRHDGIGLLAGLSNPFDAGRYHSLEVKADTLASDLEPLAWTEDGTLMAMRHRSHPYWGVQFHPESILTSEGSRLLANFLALCGESGAS